MRTCLFCIASLAVCCPLKREVTAKTIIDSFTSGDVEIMTPNDTGRPFEESVDQDDLQDVLGGFRTLRISTATGTMSVVTEGDGLLHVSGGGGEAFSVVYGRTGSNPLNLDLTDPATSVVTVDFSRFDPAIAPGDSTNPLFRLRLLTDSTPLPTDLQLDVELSPLAGPRIVSFPLAELTGRGNLADVDALSLVYLTPRPGFEFEISEVAFVPEPSGGMLLTIGGLICLVVWSRLR